MSKPYIIVSFILAALIMHSAAFAADLINKAGKTPVVITSQTLTADNKTNTAIFEGTVLAKTNDIEIYSDKMTVFYDNSESKVKEIHAIGNVKVHKAGRALFSDEAIYIEDEKKIIFSGNPKAVEGENVISGTRIIFYLQDDRAVVDGSRVVLQNKQGLD